MTLPILTLKPEFSGHYCTVNWMNSDGHRCHVWVKNGVLEDRFYINPPISVAYRAPGYFDTRKGDMTAKRHAKLREAIRKLARPENIAEVLELQAKQREEAAAAAAATHVKKLRAAVEGVLGTAARLFSDDTLLRLEKEIYLARTA